RDEVLTTGHEEFGEIAVARLRASAERYPADPALQELLAELRTKSEEFRQTWDAAPTRVPGHRMKYLTHPEAGRLKINCDVLPIPADAQQPVSMPAAPGSPPAGPLRRLARQSVTECPQS